LSFITLVLYGIISNRVKVTTGEVHSIPPINSVYPSFSTAKFGNTYPRVYSSEYSISAPINKPPSLNEALGSVIRDSVKSSESLDEILAPSSSLGTML
jgi:hypothetical protein